MMNKAVQIVTKARKKLPEPSAYSAQTITVIVSTHLKGVLRPFHVKVTFQRMYTRNPREYFWKYKQSKKL